MQSTPFEQKHIALGAKMAPFAGYNMPISYAGINIEHAAVRKHAGVFDVSHMGEFIIKGSEALDLIQRITTNDASKLTKGKAQYSCFTNEQGGIIDDLIVYCLEENKAYMLVVNASNIEKDWNWVVANNTQQAELHNISAKTCLLAVQGPNATKILQKLTDVDIMNLAYYTFVRGTFAGIPNVLISATGYTGSGGVELYFEDSNNAANIIWDAIFAADENIQPIGLGARDTLRLEMGYCLYGNDINDTTSPLEAGLGWITKLNKTTPFTAQTIVANLKQQGITRKLVGFEMLERGIPRHDYIIKNADGENIGIVTSGTQAPSLQKAVGLGYVAIQHANLDSEIFIEIRNQLVKAKVVKFPFS
jgi:aminomethyltransferase